MLRDSRRVSKQLSLTAVLIAAIALSCAERSFDEAQFANLVAEQIVNEELRGSGKTVVIDDESFASLPSDVQAAISQALEDAGVPVVRLEEIERWDDLGEWTGARAHRRNQTHVVLDLEIESEGGERQLRWSYVCGPLCGEGAEVSLSWVGDGWVAERTALIRH